MVFDLLKNLPTYAALYPEVKSVKQFIDAFDKRTFKHGTAFWHNDNFKVIFLEKQSNIQAERSVFEAHRYFLDIHYTLEGADNIGVAFIDNLITETPYEEEKDYQLYKGQQGVSLTNTPATFILLTPSDGHVTGYTESYYKKMVFKVKI